MTLTQRTIKTIIILLLVMILCGGMFSCYVPSRGMGSLGLCLMDTESRANTRINIYAHPNGGFFLFLPAGAYDYKTNFICSALGRTSVNGISVKNGTPNDVITHDGVYSISCGGVSYSLTVLSSANLPALFIDTASGSLKKIHADKDYKEAGWIRVFENGALSASQELSSIKGRGNTTWEFDKKPYNIKFAEATPLLGMDAAKKWCLLANAADPSLIRTDIAFALAREIGIDYVCDCRHADVYINGDYMGDYLVSEAVEAALGRVEITDLDDLNEAANPGVDIKNSPLMTSGGETDCGNKRWTDIPISPTNITGGYLLEYDSEKYFSNEVNGFVTSEGQCVTVKSPISASKDEIEYISRFCEEAEEALLSSDGMNSQRKHYGEYYDIDALSKMFILHEFLLNFDAGGSSCFFAKEADGGKLTAVCPWDFDASAGNYYNRSISRLLTPNTRCLPMLICSADTMLPTVYSLAYRHEDFRSVVREQWPCLKSAFLETRDKINSMAKNLTASFVCDCFRWKQMVVQTRQEWESIYLNHYIGALETFFDERTVLAEKEFMYDPALLFYDCGDVQCFIVENALTFPGNQVTVKSIEDSLVKCALPEGYRFREWNTEKDGGGESYQPGDVITLDRLCTVLYAQWDKDSP